VPDDRPRFEKKRGKESEKGTEPKVQKKTHQVAKQCTIQKSRDCNPMMMRHQIKNTGKHQRTRRDEEGGINPQRDDEMLMMARRRSDGAGGRRGNKDAAGEGKDR